MIYDNDDLVIWNNHFGFIYKMWYVFFGFLQASSGNNRFVFVYKICYVARPGVIG